MLIYILLIVIMLFIIQTIKEVINLKKIKYIAPKKLCDNTGTNLFIDITKNPAYNELKKSINEHDIIEPIRVLRKNDSLIIIDGHMRKKIAQEIGIETVPYIDVESEHADPILAYLDENKKKRSLNIPFAHIFTDNDDFDEVNIIASQYIDQTYIKKQVSINLFEFAKTASVEELESFIRVLITGRKTRTQYLVYNHVLEIESEENNLMHTLRQRDIDTHYAHEIIVRLKSSFVISKDKGVLNNYTSKEV